MFQRVRTKSKLLIPHHHWLQKMTMNLVGTFQFVA